MKTEERFCLPTDSLPLSVAKLMEIAGLEDDGQLKKKEGIFDS